VIVEAREVEQSVDRGDRDVFLKEIVITPGEVPLAMVRKRAVASASCVSPASSAFSAAATRAPVLLIHGFGQNRYAWHLPSRSLVNHLARAGFDVFNVDLRGHGRSRHLSDERARGVDDYVTRDLPAAIGEVRRLSGGRPVYLVGHSLGGLVAYACAPLLEGAIAGIVSIGSPYHFTRGSPILGALSVVARGVRFAPLPGASLREVPVTIKPIGALMRTFRRVAESPLYPMLRGWHAGAVEADVLEEHLRLAFDRAGLGETMNLFEWADERRFGGASNDYVERFESMNLPLLVVAGTHDDLAPPEGVRPAFARSHSGDKTYRALPLGHIDLLVGRDAPKSTWPLVTEWLHRRAS